MIRSLFHTWPTLDLAPGLPCSQEWTKSKSSPHSLSYTTPGLPYTAHLTYPIPHLTYSMPHLGYPTPQLSYPASLYPTPLLAYPRAHT